MELDHLVRGRKYERKALHLGGLGGNRQKGISYPAAGDHVLLFSDPSDHSRGYLDGPEGQNRYRYSGEWNGAGPMRFTAGNLAIVERSPQLYLFVRDETRYTYRGRYQYVDHEIISAPHDGVDDEAILFRLIEVRSLNSGSPTSPVEEILAAGVTAEIVLRSMKIGAEPSIDPAAFEGPADPARQRALLEKAVRGHRRLLARLAAAFGWSEARCFEARDSVDLMVTEPGKRSILVEVKTISGNPVGRVRLGLAQIYEYAYRLADKLGPNPILVLAVDGPLETPDWLISYLTQNRGITIISMDADETLVARGPAAAELAARAPAIRAI